MNFGFAELTIFGIVFMVSHRKYRKIPKISPGAYIFQKLIHGGAYFRNFTVCDFLVFSSLQFTVSLIFHIRISVLNQN